MIFWSAFLLGLLGSLHCLGMCGPIALALPGGSAAPARLLAGRVLYNTGRIVTYSILGLGVGFLGRLVHLAGLQQGLSIAVGILILAGVLLLTRYAGRLDRLGALQAPWFRLKNALARRMKNPSTASLFTIGLLNGLLPCGLVYVALGAAATSGSALGGMLAMAAFGAGTFPLMLAATLSAPFVRSHVRVSLQRLVPITLVAVAALLILRGMSLGIPYISPDLSQPDAPACHGCHPQ